MAGIRVQSVSKRFRRQAGSRSYTLQEAFIRGFRRSQAYDEFWALQDVSLAVAGGEMVGVIGRNGAGKSSLLRLVGGVGKPDGGSIVVEGRLGALIDLGAGFHPELTGRENAYMNGVISGLSRRQMDAILDEIVQFAELEAFIDGPLRTYSTGMQLRLAFAVAVHIQPEVLLVDEVLAVGDLGFQQKCLDRIRQLQAGGAAILFVTHDLGMAQQFCDRIVWLNGGRVAAAGAPDEVVSAYREAMQRMTRQRTPAAQPDEQTAGGEVLSVNHNRFGSLEVELHDVQLRDRQGAQVTILPADRGLTVGMHWRTEQLPRSVIFNVGIFNADGLLLCEVSSPPNSLDTPHGQICLTFDRLDLTSGCYRLDVGVYPVDWSYAYDYHWQAYSLQVETPGDSKGPLRPPYTWQLAAVNDVYKQLG